MPRILIKEIDNTKPGNVVGANFDVVIPGKVGLPLEVKTGEAYLLLDSADGCYYYYDASGVKGKKVFDENGIYVCNNVKDFEKYVGKKDEPYESIAAKACESTPLKPDDEDAYEIESGTKVYSRTEITDTEAKKIGKLVNSENDKYYKYKFEFISDGHGTHTEEYFSVEDEGQDAVEAALKSVGNQFAYNLLKLGYTVIYVKSDDGKLSSTAEDALKDKSIYTFRYITGASIYDNSDINNSIKEIAASRGDCTALVDIDEEEYTGSNRANALDNIQNVASSDEKSKYYAYFAPTLFIENVKDNSYTNEKMPASFYYLACASKTFNTYPEWFAVSGYTRGLSDLKINGLTMKFGEKAIQKLQPRTVKDSETAAAAVNLIITINDAYYLWGNRTAHKLDSNGLIASHFLNIRQLSTTLKHLVYSVCRRLTFEPNSDMLWLNFCNAIRPALEVMKAQQGIKDYKFEQLPTSMKAKLFAAIRIVPIEAVEDFEITIAMEDNLDNPTVSISEDLAEYSRED